MKITRQLIQESHKNGVLRLILFRSRAGGA